MSYQGKNFPDTYKGYSTAELIRVWEAIPHNRRPTEPPEKVLAMRALLREYRLAPVFQEPRPKVDTIIVPPVGYSKTG